MMQTEPKNKLSDYDYDLPESLIAEFPPARRPEARLMQLPRSGGEIRHGRFDEILDCLRSGDVLVLNDTKVIPARLKGSRSTGGKAEALLLREFEDGSWDALLKPSSRIAEGDPLYFEGNGQRLEAVVLDDAREGSGTRRIRFSGSDVRRLIDQVGEMPLPPYIRRETQASDREDYQTVFAKHEGAVAAPTAGLHFDQDLLQALKRKGVEVVAVTLHTGYGTFQPVNVEDILEHRMFEESFEITEETALKINAAKREGRRVIACGTTSVRALEASAAEDGAVRAERSRTSIFIYPPYAFRIVEGLITNFHLPKSTLLMLVSAFAGYENLRRAYDLAVREQYRFYSYGDAMLIL